MTDRAWLASEHDVPRAESAWSRALALAIPAVLVIVVAGAALAVHRSNTKRQDLAVAAHTNDVAVAVADRMNGYTEVLRGLTAVVSPPSEMPRQAFHEVVERLDVDARYPGVQVIGVAERVPRAALEPFVAAVGSEAEASGLPYPTFRVHPETSAATALPITFVEPLATNASAFGFDFFSEANRRDAAMRARDTGDPTATAPVTLMQETGSQRAILVMTPIYERGAPITTVAQRRAAFQGVVYAAFRMGDLLGGILGSSADDVAIVDAATAAPLLGEQAGPVTTLPAARSPHSATIEVGSRLWRLSVDGSEAMLPTSERWRPVGILVAGLSIAAMLSGLLQSMRRTRSRALTLAAEMTGGLNALSDAASEAIISVDDTGRIVSWNHGATTMFGWRGDEMVGEHATAIVSLRDRLAFDEGFALVAGGGGEDLFRTSVSLHGRRSNGEEFPAELSLARWSARGQHFFTAFVRDVTEREAAVLHLRETTETLTAVLEAATELSIIGTDRNGTITFVNAGAERMLGYRSEDLVGTSTVIDIHDPVEVARRAEELGLDPGFEVFVQFASRGVPETREWTYVRRDGERVPVDLTVTPMLSEYGHIDGFIGIAVDVSRRVKTEQAQAQALEHERQVVAQLRELDQAKSDFVSNMSHELRTPLTSIVGYSELLADAAAEAGDQRAIELVGMVERNAQRLLVLVEDLLVLSRIESGSLRLHHQPCDVDRLVAGAVAAVSLSAASHGVELRSDVEPDLVIDADAGHLERAIINVLGNAVKFSHPSGTVDVAARADGTDVLISVTDHGIGIPSDERDKVLDRFFRSRKARELGIQGTGLGLAIVAGIVERHDGRLEVDSVEGAGTTVTMRLPALVTHDAPAHEREAVT